MAVAGGDRVGDVMVGQQSRSQFSWHGIIHTTTLIVLVALPTAVFMHPLLVLIFDGLISSRLVMPGRTTLSSEQVEEGEGMDLRKKALGRCIYAFQVLLQSSRCSRGGLERSIVATFQLHAAVVMALRSKQIGKERFDMQNQ